MLSLYKSNIYLYTYVEIYYNALAHCRNINRRFVFFSFFFAILFNKPQQWGCHMHNVVEHSGNKRN